MDVRALSADEAAILAWFNGTETLPQPGYPSPGQAALRRWARSHGDLIGDALAGALEEIGSSPRKIELKRRRAGRPDGGVKLLAGQSRLGEQILAEPTAKVRDKVGDAVRKAGKSPSTGYTALAAAKRARVRRMKASPDADKR